MKHVDDILAVIDAGLQSTHEASYGHELASASPNCVRCHADLDDGDLCDPCRAFLLGDATEDPAAGVDADSIEGMLTFAASAAETMTAAFTRFVEHLNGLPAVVEQAHRNLHAAHADDEGWRCPFCLIDLRGLSIDQDEPVQFEGLASEEGLMTGDNRHVRWFILGEPVASPDQIVRAPRGSIAYISTFGLTLRSCSSLCYTGIVGQREETR